MFHRLVALAGGERDIGGGHVILKIDEALGPAARCPHLPDRHQRRLGARLGFRRRRRPALMAAGAGPFNTDARRLFGDLGKVEDASGGTGRAFLGAAGARHESGEVRVPVKRAAALRKQVDAWRPTAGHGDTITINRSGDTVHALPIGR